MKGKSSVDAGIRPQTCSWPVRSSSESLTALCLTLIQEEMLDHVPVQRRIFSWTHYHRWGSLTVKVPGQMSQWKEPQTERLVSSLRPRLCSPSPGLPTLSEVQCVTGGSCSFLACRTGTLSTEEVLCLGPFVPSTPNTCSAHVHIGTEWTAPRQAFGCQAKE